jgi:hypothetical protein
MLSTSNNAHDVSDLQRFKDCINNFNLKLIVRYFKLLEPLTGKTEEELELVKIQAVRDAGLGVQEQHGIRKHQNLVFNGNQI